MKPSRQRRCLDEQTVAALIEGRLQLLENPEVESHLAECTECQSLVAAASEGLASTSMGVALEQSDVVLPRGLLADKYRLEGLLGRGGMGTVFAARHDELGQRVAIKMLHSAEPSAAARFLREAKISAQLVNEHIARVFDFGRTAEGVPYLVMEYLEGEDLAKVITRGRLDALRAIELALQACFALADAHAANIVHRDLKPSNLFLTRRADRADTLKVLDFGISKRLIQGLSEVSQSLTNTQAVIGSPAYMSPEQIRASKAVDARSDIWSLGVVLYEMLTGQRPFSAPTLSALAVSIATEAPRLPSSINPGIPSPLDAVVLRCLSKAPEERFQSVAELSSALRDALSQGAAPVGAARAKRGGQRRWAALLLCGLAGTSGALLWLRGQHRVAVPSPVPQSATLRTSVALRPALELQCDDPPPPGSVRFEGASGVTLLRLPASELCRAVSAPAQREQLAAALGGAPAGVLRAELEPPHPFYALTVSSGGPLRIGLQRAHSTLVGIRLVNVACAALQRVEVTPHGLPGVLADLGGATPVRSSECLVRVELPVEAFQRRLSFRLLPARHSAGDAQFGSAELETSVRLAPSASHATSGKKAPSLRAVEPAVVKQAAPKPCEPPQYCRD